MDLPVPRRPRPHRQPRRRARPAARTRPCVANFGIVGRLAVDIELPLDRMRWLEPATRSTSATGTLHDRAPADLRLAGDTRLPRLDRRSCCGPSTRSARSCRARSTKRPTCRADLYEPSFAMLNTWNTPVARVARHRAVRRARADDSRDCRLDIVAERARAGAARRRRSTTRSRARWPRRASRPSRNPDNPAGRAAREPARAGVRAERERLTRSKGNC